MALDTEAPVDNREQDVAAAFDKLANETGAPAPAGESPASLPSAGVTPAPGGVAPVTEAPKAPEEGRDALGRFQPKKTEPPGAPGGQPVRAVPAPAAPGATAPAAAAAPADERLARAPGSWKAEDRAHWEKVPPEAREVILRREHEVVRALESSAGARRALGTLTETLAPFRQNIAAMGGDAVGAIKSFFAYDNSLRHGSQIERAKAVSSIIKEYGVDIVALDAELAGAAHDPKDASAALVAAEIQKALAPMREFMGQQEANRARAVADIERTAEESLTRFAADPAHKHYERVREVMADVLDLAANQGRSITLKQAYEAACWQVPEIRSILVAEATAGGARTGTEAAQRARAAAVSVRGAPNTAPSAVDTAQRSRADDVAAAYDQLAGRE